VLAAVGKALARLAFRPRASGGRPRLKGAFPLLVAPTTRGRARPGSRWTPRYGCEKRQFRDFDDAVLNLEAP
jgi:hypothetical protein